MVRKWLIKKIHAFPISLQWNKWKISVAGNPIQSLMFKKAAALSRPESNQGYFCEAKVYSVLLILETSEW